MKKFIISVFTVLLLALAVYGYDIMSGYMVTKTVNDFLDTHTPTEVVQEPVAETGVMRLNKVMYSQLSKDEKRIYDTVYNGISCFKNPIYVKSAPDSEIVFRIVRTVLGDHPEIFWSKGGCNYSTDGILKMDYIYTRAEAMEKQELIENKIKSVLASIDSDKSEYEKALQLYDWVALNTKYDYDNADNLEAVPAISTIEGVFLNGYAVCSGYSKAYQLLLQRSGIDALYITGTATSQTGTEKHAWICQMLDGYYYFSDPTWGDSYERTTKSNFVSHAYFCMTYDEISLTHTENESFSNIYSNATADNYFKKEGLLLDSYSFSDTRTIIKNSIIKNDNAIEFKFSNENAYEIAKTQLFDNGDIYMILKSIDPFSHNINNNEISYNFDDQYCTIIVIYKKS